MKMFVLSCWSIVKHPDVFVWSFSTVSHSLAEVPDFGRCVVLRSKGDFLDSLKLLLNTERKPSHFGLRISLFERCQKHAENTTRHDGKAVRLVKYCSTLA